MPRKAMREMAIENLALRQQLAVYQQAKKRPKLSNLDRIFWMVLSRISTKWKEVLVVLKPETVIGWHRKGFQLAWRRKDNGPKPGRPKIDKELQILIRSMAKDIVACDFLVVLTITFNLLYVFILLSDDRRRIIHFH